MRALFEQFGGAAVPEAKIAIIYYTSYGHMKSLVDAVKTGLEEAGCEVDTWIVPEVVAL